MTISPPEWLTLKRKRASSSKLASNLCATSLATSCSERESKSRNLLKCPGIIQMDRGGLEPQPQWRCHPQNPIFFLSCFHLAVAVLVPRGATGATEHVKLFLQWALLTHAITENNKRTIVQNKTISLSN